MKNENSSDGMAEDLIRSFVQTGCGEIHAKTLYEKAVAELENGIIDIDDADVVKNQLEKIEQIKEEISELAELRRKIMIQLFEMYDGDKTYWCQVKHLGIGAYTLFEAYQASDDDQSLLDLANDANKAFIKALSHFLGMTPVDCAACFSDMLKAKGE